MTPYEAESKTIDLLRLPLAIGVIFIHMNMKVHGNMVHWTDFGSMDAYRVFFICNVQKRIAATRRNTARYEFLFSFAE